jgi:hypoxanthine phosphoribosyltransferase
MPNNIAKDGQQIDQVSWEDVEMGVSMIADALEEIFLTKKVSVYGIPRGGMIPAIMLVHLLESRGWTARFAADLNHLMPNELHNIIVLDEICDSGDTFKVVTQLFPMAKTATVFHRESAKFTPDYYAYVMHDERWLRFPWEVM